jgi:hypothetical protein
MNGFYEYVAEALYGDEYTKHDKQNVKRKYQPIIEGEELFCIKDKKLSLHFIEMVINLYEDKMRLKDEVYHLKKKIKKETKEEKDYNFINNLYQKELEEKKQFREKLFKEHHEELLKNVEDSKPYKNLYLQYCELKQKLDKQDLLHNEIDNLKQHINDIQTQNAQYVLEMKSQEQKRFEEKIKKQTAEITQNLENKFKTDTENLENKYKEKYKNLENKSKLDLENLQNKYKEINKEKIKNLNHKLEKFKKKIKKLEKINLELQKSKLDESDSDSDIESD